MLARVLRRINTLRQSFRAKSLILMYHRIDAPPMDPWGVCVSPEVFREQMESVAELNAACPLPQIQARSGQVAITFDDGYADNYYRALPILKELNIPATFFIVAGTANTPAFWWDELERLIFYPRSLPREPLRIGSQRKELQFTLKPEDLEWSDEKLRSFPSWIAWRHAAPTSRHSLFVQVWEQLRRMSHADRATRLAAIRNWTGEPPYRSDLVRPMTHEELRLVAAEPAIELGGHSVTHSRLAALSHNAQHEEIEGSRSFLTDLTGKQPASFAFPFGNTGDFTPATVDLVRDAGFQRACTTIRHAVDRSTDSYTLPRIHVENWRKDRFSKWLRKELREGQSPQAWS